MLCVKSENISFHRQRKRFHQKLFPSGETLATHIFDICLGENSFFLLSREVTPGSGEVLINACLGYSEGIHVSMHSLDRH